MTSISCRYLLLLLTWAWFGLPSTSAADHKPLEIGVFPYLSVRAVLTTYQPIRRYLQRELGQPVELYTAPDFRTFIERTRQGEYDVLITAPHFARLAQVQTGYEPLAGFTKELHPIIVVATSSPFKNLADLRGKTVVIPDRLAIVSMIGLRLLREQGIESDRDFRLVSAVSHNSAVLDVTRAKADAAITEAAALQQMPEELRNGVRVIATAGKAPHVMLMAHPRLGRSTIQKLRYLLEQFARNSPEGREFLVATGYEGMKPVSETEMKGLDPYAQEIPRILRASP
jgi:phosphonate transport system substrate-binding protein